MRKVYLGVKKNHKDALTTSQIWPLAVEGRVSHSNVGRTVECRRRDRRELPQSINSITNRSG